MHPTGGICQQTTMMELHAVFPTLGTVWKFQDFSVIQILLEITFGEYRTSKTAILWL